MRRAHFTIHVGRGRRATAAIVAATVVSLTATIGIAQNAPSATVGSYKVPRTADGHPDLQGYWTNLTYTPFERPRALANKPSLILADEPTGNLDTQVGKEIMGIFKELRRDKGITLIIITHDPEVAAEAERTVWIRDGLVVSG